MIAVVGACSSASSAPTTTAAPTTTTAPASSTVPGGSSTTTTETPGFTSGGFRTRRAGVLIVGTERLDPPWYVASHAGAVSGGFEYDLVAELARRLGVPTVAVVPTSLVLMMTGQDCKCDVMLSGIAITDARARSLDLSEPYMSADQAVLVRKGTTIRTAAAAAALRWGVALRNGTGTDVVQNRIKPTAGADVVVNEDEGARRLAAGTIDAMVLDAPEAVAMANRNAAFAVAGQYKTGDQYAVALSLGSPNTALINDVMRGMRSDGTIDTLVRAYFGMDPSKIPAIGP
jgi:polar amino acid transport system substrate-binding protein